jgi:hypothetical protein
MDKEEIIFGYIPVIISVILIVFSFRIFVRQRKLFSNGVLFLLILFFNSIAMIYLLPMLKGAYPTILPHLLVLISLPIFIFQYKFYKK